MTLNKDEIIRASLITSPASKNFRSASYDLTVEKIIDMDGNVHDFYKIPPQGMVYVVFQEEISMDEEHIGFAHVKTSITQRGIMATNIGIVDPGYKGFISTLLINFGSSNETIIKGDAYLRLSFNKINRTDVNSNALALSKDAYLNARRKDTDNLSSKFLNLNTVKDEVLKKVVKALIGLSIIFSAASFALGMYFQNKTSSDKDYQKRYDAQQAAFEMLKAENNVFKKTLLNKLDSVNTIKK